MNSKIFAFLMMSVALVSCGDNSKFPIEKRFWTPDDYDYTIRQIAYVTPEDEEYPRFSNPETSIVIQKLLDPQNYEVVLDDTELGLNHRNDVSQAFFDKIQDMEKAYSKMDVQDKYVYAQELIEMHKFGLGFQLKYFKLGNERILAQSDAPDAARTKEIITSNDQTIVRNFTIYLDHIGDEKYYEPYAPLLAEGITTHFFSLIEQYPNANYDGMLNKANLILKKVQTQELKTALTSLINRLESRKGAEVPKE